MTLETLIPLKARTGIAALAFIAVVMPLPAAGDSFVFSTGRPDRLMATATRPGTNSEIETGDDFVLTQQTSITGATFIGLIPSTASISDIKNVVIEIYRVFPNDSDVSRTSGPPTFSTPNVPTRVNSPSDVELVGRDTSDFTITATTVVDSFTVANSVTPGGVHLTPPGTTSGNGQHTA